MIIIKKKSDCCGCEACANVCPKSCILMQLKEGFYYPEVDSEKCVNCHLCEKVCPQMHHEHKITEPKLCIAGYLNDDDARFRSTSGGLAYALAKGVIDNNGVAYGVVFDRLFQPVFQGVYGTEDLCRLQGSKYPQARVGGVYKEIKKELALNRKVIFFGTPCQVYGLRNYLDNPYDNLILVDLICHGVPSPEIWTNYLQEMFPGETVSDVVFKHKKDGWKKWHVYIKTNKTEYFRIKLEDSYMSSFLLGYNVRECCFNCQFKGSVRLSDITIADGWGIPEKDAGLNDGMGLSTIIINTDKGKSMVDSIADSLILKEYSLEDLISGNQAYSNSIKKNKFYNSFWRSITNEKTVSVLRNYAVTSPLGKIRNKLSSLMK